MLIRWISLIAVLVVLGCSGRGQQVEHQAEGHQKLKSQPLSNELMYYWVSIDGQSNPDATSELASKINKLKPCFEPLASQALPNFEMKFERKKTWKIKSGPEGLGALAECLSKHLDSEIKTFAHEGVPVIHLQNHSVSDEIRARSGPALRLQSLRVQIKKNSK